MQKRQTEKIFSSLESAGFPRSLQRALLPDWVTPEVLSDEAASPEIAAILAKRLGLRVSRLLGSAPSIEVLRRRDTRYKRSIPNRSRNLIAATSIAVAIAESVAVACRVTFKPLPSSAALLRADVLARFPGKWLGLRNLLMECWAHGIPVIYLDRLGDGVSRMDGMVIQTRDRPVIVLSKASTLWAWQLFILAHEVGHIALGHVDVDEILIDEDLGTTSYALDDADEDERAADQFAIELLNGRWDATYSSIDSRINSRELADAAYRFGVENNVDPAHIALNFAHHTKHWDVGVGAANILQGDLQPAAVIINEAMWGGIDKDLLPNDTLEFIQRATGSIVG